MTRIGPAAPGPGLVKARVQALVGAWRPTLVRANDARWRELFARADIVSEGGVREDTSGPTWYGSTSVVLPAAGDDLAFFAAVAERDVHVRVRALRLAHREACARAPHNLGRLSCEIHFVADPGGVRIDVDVQAPLIVGSAASRTAR